MRFILWKRFHNIHQDENDPGAYKTIEYFALNSEVQLLELAAAERQQRVAQFTRFNQCALIF
jgi:hypothetical protein